MPDKAEEREAIPFPASVKAPRLVFVPSPVWEKITEVVSSIKEAASAETSATKRNASRAVLEIVSVKVSLIS